MNRVVILFVPLQFLTGLLISQTKIYDVNKIDIAIEVDGKPDVNWNYANTLTDFEYPWREEQAPLTTFKALWNDTQLYFLFYASDSQILLQKKGLGERDAVHSDRVEVFFKSEDTEPYYSLEMDAIGRVLDTKGIFTTSVDFDWHWPQGELVVATSKDSDGYWVEGSVSLQSLSELGIYRGDLIIKAGLYRGEYVKEDKVTTKWISWIHPDSETPNFHIPSSFGELHLKQ